MCHGRSRDRAIDTILRGINRIRVSSHGFPGLQPIYEQRRCAPPPKGGRGL